MVLVRDDGGRAVCFWEEFKTNLQRQSTHKVCNYMYAVISMEGFFQFQFKMIKTCIFN